MIHERREAVHRPRVRREEGHHHQDRASAAEAEEGASFITKKQAKERKLLAQDLWVLYIETGGRGPKWRKAERACEQLSGHGLFTLLTEVMHVGRFVVEDAAKRRKA